MVQGLEFRAKVKNLGFGIQDLGFRMMDFVYAIKVVELYGLRFTVYGLRFTVYGLRFTRTLHKRFRLGTR